MWILQWLPNWLFHLVLLAGVVGLLASLFLSFIPFIKTYTTPVKIGSICLIVIGVWFEGAIHNQEAWEEKVRELEAKVALANEQSKKENIKIVEKVVNKIEIVKTRGQDIVQYVDREVTKYDSQCTIPKEFIEAINRAAEAPK